MHHTSAAEVALEGLEAALEHVAADAGDQLVLALRRAVEARRPLGEAPVRRAAGDCGYADPRFSIHRHRSDCAEAQRGRPSPFRRNDRVVRYIHSFNDDGSPAATIQEQPRELFERIFGSGPSHEDDSPRSQRLRRSVLDSVLEQTRYYSGKNSPLGAASKVRLADHLGLPDSSPEYVIVLVADDPAEETGGEAAAGARDEGSRRGAPGDEGFCDGVGAEARAGAPVAAGGRTGTEAAAAVGCSARRWPT